VKGAELMSRILIFLNIFLLTISGSGGYFSPDIIYDNQENPQNSVEVVEDIDLELNPNELGRVMVLMLHSIGDEDGVWEISADSFRKDLEYLHNNDYYLVSLKDFVEGNMDVPAGKTPVVLTFDDGLNNNFNILEEDGELKIDPNCAVGIMENFKKENPDFNSTATFYIYGTNPFRQPEYIEYKLNFLIENGYDVGNHTYNHADLSDISNKDEIVYQIGKQVELINEYIPDYKVDTFSIPFGLRPDEKLEDFMMEGNYEGTEYKNIAALDVGSHPSYSWVDNRFDTYRIPRIRVSSTEEFQESEDWYEYFENNHDKRYISDGIKDIITVPKDMEEFINHDKVGSKEIFIYEKD